MVSITALALSSLVSITLPNSAAMLRVAFAGIDLTRDTVIVTADHGHVSRGGHGGAEPEVSSVPLVLAGKGIVPGASARNAQLVDVAPTVAALLGVPAPGQDRDGALGGVELLDRLQGIAGDVARLLARLVDAAHDHVFDQGRVAAGALDERINSGIPAFDDIGRFVGYRGVGRHITERKRAEARVKGSDGAVFEVAKGAPQAIAALTAHGANEAMEAAAVDGAEKFALDVAGVIESGGVGRLDLDV